MGRMLGAFDSDDDLDRPDLNKCPDCGCYFATDDCPLCGKTCPPDMRAGARVTPKKRKAKRSDRSGRVTFIPWYHTWWFILIMMFFMTPVGIVLFITSPYSRKWKIIISVVAIVYMIFSYTGLGNLLLRSILRDDVVNTKLSREAYVETCQDVQAKDFYRTLSYQKGYYTMTLRVVDSFNGFDDYGYEGTKYYICTPAEDSSMTILVRDCQVKKKGAITLRAGDMIRAYGESAGEITVFDSESYNPFSGPCLNLAYADLVSESEPVGA